MDSKEKMKYILKISQPTIENCVRLYLKGFEKYFSKENLDKLINKLSEEMLNISVEIYSTKLTPQEIDELFETYHNQTLIKFISIYNDEELLMEAQQKMLKLNHVVDEYIKELTNVKN